MEKRAKSKNPVQQQLRDKKKIWNAAYKEFSQRLKAFKDALNGHGSSKYGLPPSDIKNPLPSELVSFLSELSNNYATLAEESNRIMQEQQHYSETRIKPAEQKVAMASYNASSWYYDYEPGMTLQDIIDRWQKQRLDKDGRNLPRQKMYDGSMPIMFPLDLIWPYREYTWTRTMARRTPEEWDELHNDLKNNGWQEQNPLHFEIGKMGGEKVSEGNHRLSIAKQLGIKMVPVWFDFMIGPIQKEKIATASDKSAYVVIGDHKLPTLLAETPEEQEHGLMYEKQAKVMSFVYNQASINRFWMKSTPRELAIIFSLGGKITNICKGEPYSTKLIGNWEPSDLVVEMPPETAKQIGVAVGKTIQLLRA